MHELEHIHQSSLLVGRCKRRNTTRERDLCGVCSINKKNNLNFFGASSSSFHYLNIPSVANVSHFQQQLSGQTHSAQNDHCLGATGNKFTLQL